MLKMLVTGGAGFIGANLIHYLFKQYGNDIEIHNCDSLTYAGNLENLADIDQHPNYHFHKISITDAEAIYKLFERERFDIVFHLAAESHVDRSILGGREFVMTNVVGTQTLLEAAKQFPVQRFVHVSTDEVYGSLGETGAFVETTPLSPNSPYSASKAGSDLMALAYFETHKVPVVITRCSNNYGPYQFPEKLIPLMITNALENKPLPVYGTGQNIRDWIHVDDHNRGVDMVRLHGIPGQVYNLGGASERRNLDIVHAILKTLGKPESLITYVEDRKGHDYRYAMDFSKLTHLCGWTPHYVFEQGLNETIQWYLEHHTWWQRVKSGDYLAYYDQQYNRKD